MWWSPLRLMIHTEVGKWTGCGRCSIMPCVVKWPPRGTCWPGAAEWWSTRCSKGRSGEVEGWNLNGWKDFVFLYHFFSNHMQFHDGFFFIRVLEECRKAKGDMECSLYNAERRKKPAACTPKVQCSSLHSCFHNSQTPLISIQSCFPHFSALCRASC